MFETPTLHVLSSVFLKSCFWNNLLKQRSEWKRLSDLQSIGTSDNVGLPHVLDVTVHPILVTALIQILLFHHFGHLEFRDLDIGLRLVNSVHRGRLGRAIPNNGDNSKVRALSLQACRLHAALTSGHGVTTYCRFVFTKLKPAIWSFVHLLVCSSLVCGLRPDQG